MFAGGVLTAQNLWQGCWRLWSGVTRGERSRMYGGIVFLVCALALVWSLDLAGATVTFLGLSVGAGLLWFLGGDLYLEGIVKGNLWFQIAGVVTSVMAIIGGLEYLQFLLARL